MSFIKNTYFFITLFLFWNLYIFLLCLVSAVSNIFSVVQQSFRYMSVLFLISFSIFRPRKYKYNPNYDDFTVNFKATVTVCDFK